MGIAAAPVKREGLSTGRESSISNSSLDFWPCWSLRVGHRFTREWHTSMVNSGNEQEQSKKIAVHARRKERKW